MKRKQLKQLAEEEAAKKKKAEVIEKCGCECHEPDMAVMHCFPCCAYCYEKRD